MTGKSDNSFPINISQSEASAWRACNDRNTRFHKEQDIDDFAKAFGQTVVVFDPKGAVVYKSEP